MPLAFESRVQFVVYGSIEFYHNFFFFILVQVLREFYPTLVEIYSLLSAVHDLMPEHSSVLG